MSALTDTDRPSERELIVAWLRTKPLGLLISDRVDDWLVEAIERGDHLQTATQEDR